MLLAMLTPEAVGPAPPGLYEGTVLEAQRHMSVGGTWLGGYQLCSPPAYPQPGILESDLPWGCVQDREGRKSL